MSDNYFDIGKLMTQCGGKKEIAMMILDEFANQTPKDLAEIEAALAAGDLIQASKGAHRLKGAVGVLGADALFALCAELEMACRNNEAAKAPELFGSMKDLAEKCLAYLPTLAASL